MNLFGVGGLHLLQGRERDHLEALDEAISLVLSHGLAVASSEGLSQDTFATASVTVLLTAAARQAIDASQRLRSTLGPDAFRSLAEEALRWSQLRLANAQNPGASENRRHRRLWPRNPDVTVMTEDGRQCPAKLLDISMSGASMTVGTLQPIGAKLMIGKTSAHVVRVVHRPECVIAVEFARPFETDGFDEYAGL